MLFPLKRHFLINVGQIIEIGTVLESLEYYLFGSEILLVKPTLNNNSSLLNVKVTTLSKNKTKPFVLKRRIK